MVLYTEGTRSVVPEKAFELQQKACEVFAKIPQRKPSPPERATIEGMLVKEAELVDKDDGDGGEELFFDQQITSCLPLASMAQKKLFWPKEAEMGPIDPNPDTEMEERRRNRRREMRSEEQRTVMAMMVDKGWGFGSTKSLTTSSSSSNSGSVV